MPAKGNGLTVIKRLRGSAREGVFLSAGNPGGKEQIMNQPEASLAIQVLPQSVAGDETIRIVDKVIAYIKSTGLAVFVGPFETSIEGDFDRLMDIAKECQRICIREGSPGLLTYMKMAYNPAGGVWSIEQKTAKHHG
jgi:uncharacterized protein YqgV (UPF0045/DUF77 family)